MLKRNGIFMTIQTMIPNINIFNKTIPMYGLMTVIGCIFAIIYLKIAERRHRKLEADAELALIYGIIGVFIGAKLLSIITQLPDIIAEFDFLFSETALFLQKYLYSGFVFYGGLYGGIFAVWLYCKICKVDFYSIITLLLPVLVIIHGFGRIGCFCMGCCYGIPTASPFGIAFHISEIAPNGVPLVPIQLIEAFAVFALFAVLAVMYYKNRSGKEMLCVYLLSYGILRFILEFFRGDMYRGFVGSLSTSQIISIITIVFGLILLYSIFKKKKA